MSQMLSVLAEYEFFTPNTLAVLTTPTPLPAPTFSITSNGGNGQPLPPEKIIIQTSLSNIGTVYVGTSGVTVAPSEGIELSPGSSFELPTRDYSKWYAVAAATGNTCQVLYLNGTL